MNEFDVITKYFLPLANGNKSALNLADDVALIKPNSDSEIVVSKDLMVEDVHFRLSDGAFNIAAKLLLSNLSDIASSGSKPLYYSLGFSKTSDLDEQFIKDFCAGLKMVADQYEISLIGGDSVKAKDKLFFSLTIFGEAKAGKILSRNNAKFGDLIFISGTIGDAYLGLQIAENKLKTVIDKKSKEYLLSRHYLPTPRVVLGKLLLQHNLSNCAIDISDGLLADLRHICKSSKVQASINEGFIPISIAAKNLLAINQDKISISNLISGGDDYELLFTASSENQQKIMDLGKKLNIPLAVIGYLERASSDKNSIRIFNHKQQEVSINQYGYNHFI